MGDWPITAGGNRFANVGAVTSTSTGTSVSAGSANVKGAWATLSAATPISATGITLIIDNTATLIATRLMDIGIGAAASEMVVIPNILIASGLVNMPTLVHFPLRIPAGVRLAMRVQSSTTSESLRVVGILHSGVLSSPVPNTRVVSYGAVTANSRGTLINPGVTANTKPGTWTQIISATGETAHGLILALGGSADTIRANVSWLIDIGVGIAGQEQALISNYLASANTSETVEPRHSFVFPVTIPAGARLSMRAQCNNTTSDNLLDAVLYGVV